MKLRLDLRLSQKLIMTPQLQQAIKLLQLSRLELQQSLAQHLMDNPLLDELPEEAEENESATAEEQAEEAAACRITDDRNARSGSLSTGRTRERLTNFLRPVGRIISAADRRTGSGEGQSSSSGRISLL